MAKIRVHENKMCLSCKVTNRKMYLIGPMCFCSFCAHNIFHSNMLKDEIPSTDVRYKQWLAIYKEAK